MQQSLRPPPPCAGRAQQEEGRTQLLSRLPGQVQNRKCSVKFPQSELTVQITHLVSIPQIVVNKIKVFIIEI